MKISLSLLFAATLLLSSGILAGDAKPLSLDDSVRDRCLEVLRAGLRGEEFWPSMHAAEGLTLGGYGEEVIQFVEPLLATETDDQHRCGIARELVRAGDKAKAEVMLKILEGEDSYGHGHAAESLYKVFEIGDGEALRRAFQQSDNVTLKLMSAGALGRCGNPDAFVFLRKSLQNEDFSVLRIAAWILGRIGDSSDIPRLKEQLPRCEDPLLRAYVNCSLAALGDADGLAALTANLTDSIPDIRTYSATFAGDAGATGAADKLISLLEDEHPDAAIRAAQTLLMFANPTPPLSDEDISTLPFKPSEKNPRYTEGSVIALNNGSLLLATTEFMDSDSDFAKARVVGRRSADGGQTWGEKRILQENTGGLNVMSVTLRRLKSGPIAMFYLQKNSHSDLDLLVRKSTDEATAFGPPTTVTSDPGYHVVNNDRITQLTSGRLLAPAASSADVVKENHFVSHCYLSDDGGITWRNGAGHVDAAKRGAMEPEVIELRDGRVMMIVRTQLGYPGKSYSTDGGDTWGPMTSLGVQAPEAPATLRRIPSTGDLLLIWNNVYTPGAGHGGKRTPLTAAISSDEGETWKLTRNLESNKDQTFSYISLIFVRDRAVLSYWKNDIGSRKYATRFRSLPVSWFYNGSH
jgi:sialidase-1